MNAPALHFTKVAYARYVAQTLPRAEAQAERNLERQGFTAFCRRFRKLRRHARKTEQVLVSLFPGYIFIRFDHQCDTWRSINGTTGVRVLSGPLANRLAVITTLDDKHRIGILFDMLGVETTISVPRVQLSPR